MGKNRKATYIQIQHVETKEVITAPVNRKARRAARKLDGLDFVPRPVLDPQRGPWPKEEK